MQFGVITPARLQPYDRAPINKAGLIQVFAAAPHANTNRLTFTVPAGRNMQLAQLSYSILRITAAAPVGRYGVTLQAVTLTTGNINMPERNVLDNNVGYSAALSFAPILTLVPGETVNFFTNDASTAGTVDYYCQYGGQLFDA